MILRKTKDDYQLVCHADELLNVGLKLEEYKLNKKNCDSLFGVIDVKSLSEQIYQPNSFNNTCTPYQSSKRKGFVVGFNKAMELNSDKKFTEEDMREMYEAGFDNTGNDGYWIEDADTDFKDRIKLILQPTEIEVEFVMEKKVNMLYKPSFGGGSDSHYNPMYITEPKQTEAGEYLLKRKDV